MSLWPRNCSQKAGLPLKKKTRLILPPGQLHIEGEGLGLESDGLLPRRDMLTCQISCVLNRLMLQELSHLTEAEIKAKQGQVGIWKGYLILYNIHLPWNYILYS